MSVKDKGMPLRAEEYRLFRGMNPTVFKEELHFDSNFECGNLDLAIKVNEDEYDLFMRADTNTKGYNCWFFFKVYNIYRNQTVKFNLYNFSKKDLMYDVGLKVSVYRSSRKGWSQEGNQIIFKKPNKVKYVDQEGGQCVIAKKDAFCLSFSYSLSKEDKYVYFAYCLPFSYSFLLHSIESLRVRNQLIMTVDNSYRTSGGLVMPLITITNQESEVLTNFESKQVCLIIGRLHPGQTQASWLLQGFLQFICSAEGSYLRDKLIFKIFPMVNIDGVVLGNFRTGIIGRDLNRVFNDPSMSEEVKHIRYLCKKENPLIFLDFHGHSSKKYVFTYGPDYAIDHKYFLQSRLLTKLMGKSCKSFRYYACSFKISQNRSGTARAIMLKKHLVIYSYTIQTSVYGYGQKTSEILFDQKQLMSSGFELGAGFSAFAKVIFLLPKRIQLKRDSPFKMRKQSKFDANSQRQRIIPFQEKRQQDINYEVKQYFKEIIQEENDVFSKKDKEDDQNSECDPRDQYSDIELTKLFHCQDTLQKKSTKKHFRHHKINSHLYNKPIKAVTQKSVVESPEEKRVSNVSLQKVEQNKKVEVRPIKLRIYKEIPCVNPFLNRHFIGKSKYSSIFISRQFESNQIHYKSANPNSQESQITKKISKQKIFLGKPASVHLSSIKIENTYEPYSQNKDKDTTRKQTQIKDKELEKSKAKSKISIETFEQPKKPALPYLGKSVNTNPHEAKSMIEQIIERHQRKKANKARQQLRIMGL